MTADERLMLALSCGLVWAAALRASGEANPDVSAAWSLLGQVLARYLVEHPELDPVEMISRREYGPKSPPVPA